MKARPARRISPAMINLESVLDSGEHWLSWIEGAESFHAILRDKVPWDRLDGPSVAIVQNRLKMASPASQLLLNSLYLTMASAFEEFLRATIQEVATRLSADMPRYEDLDVGVRNLHLRESARILRRLDSPPDYLAITISELCTAIGSCVPGSDAVTLCAQALGDVDSLIKLENFMERMNALGKQISFDSLAKYPDVAASLKLARSPIRTVAKALKGCFESISKNRNRIAHVGGSAADVDRALMEDHRGVLRAVANRKLQLQ